MLVALGLAFVIPSLLPVTWAGYCICTRHVETSGYPCMDTMEMPSSYLYGNIEGEDCIPVAENVITKHHWRAGIQFQQVVYIEMDHNVAVKSCSVAPKGPFTYSQKCPPLMKPGTYLNPTTPTTPTTTTPTTTTTTTTASTTTSTTTTPSTTLTTTLKVLAQVPVHVSPSTKCSLPKLLHHLTTKTSASHPNAKMCSDQTHRGSDALILETCINATPDPFTWRQELKRNQACHSMRIVSQTSHMKWKVLANCFKIPKGEPVTLYINGQPLGFTALFWRCVGGTSFEIMHQACGSPPVIEDATKRFNVDLFYTVSW